MRPLLVNTLEQQQASLHRFARMGFAELIPSYACSSSVDVNNFLNHLRIVWT